MWAAGEASPTTTVFRKRENPMPRGLPAGIADRGSEPRRAGIRVGPGAIGYVNHINQATAMDRLL